MKLVKRTWDLRWLDWIFLGGYLPSLSLNYVGMSKDNESIIWKIDPLVVAATSMRNEQCIF